MFLSGEVGRLEKEDLRVWQHEGGETDKTGQDCGWLGML